MRTSPPLALAALLLPATLVAQELSIGSDMATFGSRMIAPGFTPDPLQIEVVSGGSIEVASLDLSFECVGFVSEQPDYILTLTDEFDEVGIYFEGEGDTSLIVNGADGEWYCNDDAVGLDPLVVIEGARSGQYDIWVGSYSSGETVTGTLSITELGHGPGGITLEDLITGGDDANFGHESLAPGFTPSPYRVEVTSGGSVDVSMHDDLPLDCVGYVTARPDFILDWAEGGTLLHIFFEGDGDTALVVNAPDGSWWCDDDTNGLDPRVTFKGPRAGQYDVWVASWSSDEMIEGTLGITESNPPRGR